MSFRPSTIPRGISKSAKLHAKDEATEMRLHILALLYTLQPEKRLEILRTIRNIISNNLNNSK